MAKNQGKIVRKLLSDSAWSIAGLVLMNVVAQFVLYPEWNRELGNERYGQILYLISGMNVLAISLGMSCSYARMKASADGTTYNGIYHRILLIGTLIAVPYIGIYYFFTGGGTPTVTEGILLLLLTVVTMWRYYADVEYRLTLNYRGCFFYYLTISVGYGAGILLFRATGLWPLALLPGEIAGVAVVWLRGGVLKRDGVRETREREKFIIAAVMTLLATELLSNLISNGDRMLLNAAIGGVAVTIYYQASLLGKTMTLITTPMNSVLIAHLARYKKGFTPKVMHIVAGTAAGVLLAATAGCTLASHILIRLLYPQNYDLVRGYFWVANMAQVAYFTGGVAATVLLRFCRIRYQLYMNMVYAGLFLCLCVPGALLGGLDGFCWAQLGASALRLGYILFLGYRSAITGKGLEDGTGKGKT